MFQSFGSYEKKIPLFFYSAVYQRPELDIEIGISYFNGNFTDDRDGYYQLIPLGKISNLDTSWYPKIIDMNDTRGGEKYAASINRALANLERSTQQKQFVVFVGDGTFSSIDELERIKNEIKLSENRQLRILLFCTDSYLRRSWEQFSKEDRIKIEFIDFDANSYSWLYQISQEILGVANPAERATMPNLWLNTGIPESESSESMAMAVREQVNVAKTESFGPIAGDSQWRFRAVQLLEGGRIEINGQEYVVETANSIPNFFDMSKFHPIDSECEPQNISVKYTGPGPALYWIEQKKPIFSAPTMEMSEFSIASSSMTAIIKTKVKDVPNLSNLELCYQPFLKIGSEIKPSPLISPSCSFIICGEQSSLVSRYQLEAEFAKNASVSFGLIRNYDGEIVSESNMQPAPFIIQTQDTIKGRSAESGDRFKDSMGKPVVTYIFDVPVFFYDPTRWNILIQARSTLDESLLSGRNVSEINQVCPNQQTDMTKTDNRMKYAISSENDYIRFFFASNVAWDFDSTYAYPEYCGFESFTITWSEKETNEIVKWACYRSIERLGLVCNLEK